MTKAAAPAADAAPEAPAVNHRADAARAFLSTWLPAHAVPADAFSRDDALALLAAIDAGAKAAG